MMPKREWRRLEEYIETETERIDKKYETMAEQFTQLEVCISELNSQASALEALMGTSSDDDS